MAALILKSFFAPPKYVGKHFNNRNGNSKVDHPYCHSTTLSSSKNLKITHDHKKQLRNHTHIHATNSKELVADNDQQGLGIVHFLKGKQFLITGVTGFLGKVLIEKILRVAPDVGKIYVLINSENTEAAMKRMKNEIMDVELFKCIRETHGESYESFMMSKLVPIVGNICESDVGLHEDEANTIAQQVDIIVNSAANTSFIQRYDTSLNANTRGPSNLVRFAKSCKKLKLFLHVSTVYANREKQGQIMEEPFRMGDIPTLDVEGEIKLALQYSKEVFSNNNSSLTKKMKELGSKRTKEFGWHNVYAFTKAMGEMMLDSLRGDIPVVIIRPAIIESTLKDPFPGWIEGKKVLDLITINYGKGKLVGFVADPDVVVDIINVQNVVEGLCAIAHLAHPIETALRCSKTTIKSIFSLLATLIPVDMVVNTMLAAMTRHATMDKSAGGDINIYHVGSSVTNPINLRHLFGRLLHEYFTSFPLVDSTNRPIKVSPFQFFNSIEEMYAHILGDVDQQNGSSHSNDAQLKSVYLKSMKTTQMLVNVYKPYMFYAGRFDISSIQKLMEHISDDEKKKFDFDVRNIDWKYYITNVHIPGLRRHLIEA